RNASHEMAEEPQYLRQADARVWRTRADHRRDRLVRRESAEHAAPRHRYHLQQTTPSPGCPERHPGRPPAPPPGQLQDVRPVHGPARTTTIVLVVVGLLVGQLLGFGIARLIARPLRATVAVLEGVAGGDLTKRVAVDGKDEVGQMSSTLNRALERMGQVVQSIGRNAEVLGHSSVKLSAVSTQTAV